MQAMFNTVFTDVKLSQEQHRQVQKLQLKLMSKVVKLIENAEKHDEL